MMKLKTLICTLPIFTALSCNGADQNKAPEKKKPDEKSACEICLIEDQIDDCEKGKVYGMVTGKDQTYQDSLLVLQDSLNLVLKSKVDYFKTELHLKSDFIALDSARNWCIGSYTFGASLSQDTKDSLYIYLYDEISNGKSGFFIHTPKHINDDLLRTDDDGRKWYSNPQNRAEKVYVDNNPNWKNELLAQWQKWMDRIDVFIVRLAGKKYADMSEAEKYAFHAQINIFYTETKTKAVQK